MLLGGIGVVFLLVISVPRVSIHLDSRVQIGCVVPRSLTRLSPGHYMIPDEGIMACPIG
jgi:hypothetical protein